MMRQSQHCQTSSVILRAHREVCCRQACNFEATRGSKQRVNADVGVHWVLSFLSTDTKKTYCLYEAPSAGPIREAARRAHLPVDVIVEVGKLRPEQFV